MKFQKIFIVIVFIMITMGCTEKKQLENKKLKFLKFNTEFKNDSLRVVAKISDDFFCLYDKKIYKYSEKKGKIIEKCGGFGTGPGEFQNINLIKIQANKVLIADWQLHRISEFDFNLNLESSFVVNSSYIRDIIIKNGTYYLLGNFYINNKKEAPLLEILDKKNNKSNCGLYVDLKKEKCFKKYRLSLLNSAFCLNNDSLFIVNSALENLYSYNILTKKSQKYKIDFAGYIRPSKINVKKEKKDKMLLKSGLQNLSATYFFYSPQKMWYDKNLNMFIITYYLPYQIQKQNNFATMYVHVFFNRKFEEIYQVKSNYKIINVYDRNNKTYLFVKNLANNLYNEKIHFKVDSKYQEIIVEKI